jgi:hypothetical protein
MSASALMLAHPQGLASGDRRSGFVTLLPTMFRSSVEGDIARKGEGAAPPRPDDLECLRDGSTLRNRGCIQPMKQEAALKSRPRPWSPACALSRPPNPSMLFSRSATAAVASAASKRCNMGFAQILTRPSARLLPGGLGGKGRKRRCRLRWGGRARARLKGYGGVGVDEPLRLAVISALSWLARFLPR